MRYLVLLLLATSVCADITPDAVGEVTIRLPGEDVHYSQCDLIWNSQAGSGASSVTYIQTGCLDAPLEPQTVSTGYNTALYVNSERYFCRLNLFTFVSVPENGFVVIMDCTAPPPGKVFESGFEGGVR